MCQLYFSVKYDNNCTFYQNTVSVLYSKIKIIKRVFPCQKSSCHLDRNIDWRTGLMYIVINNYCVWQVGPNDPNCDSGGEGLKHMSSSDDSIIRPGADTAAMAGAERGDSSGPESGSGSGPAVCPSSGSTTHTSFILKRQRHSSVPQTARTQVRGSGAND